MPFFIGNPTLWNVATIIVIYLKNSNSQTTNSIKYAKNSSNLI
jgi:hypothetical protein